MRAVASKVGDACSVEGWGDVPCLGEWWLVVCGGAVVVTGGEGHVYGVPASDADRFAGGEDGLAPGLVFRACPWVCHLGVS